MSRTIDAIKQDKIGASSVVPYLKGKGVKDEEIKGQTLYQRRENQTAADVDPELIRNKLIIPSNLKYVPFHKALLQFVFVIDSHVRDLKGVFPVDVEIDTEIVDAVPADLAARLSALGNREINPPPSAVEDHLTGQRPADLLAVAGTRACQFELTVACDERAFFDPVGQADNAVAAVFREIERGELL